MNGKCIPYVCVYACVTWKVIQHSPLILSSFHSLLLLACAAAMCWTLFSNEVNMQHTNKHTHTSEQTENRVKRETYNNIEREITNHSYVSKSKLISLQVQLNRPPGAFKKENWCTNNWTSQSNFRKNLQLLHEIEIVHIRTIGRNWFCIECGKRMAKSCLKWKDKYHKLSSWEKT